ncbi:hypothetical protein EGW08_023677 [Elysia chlorotica]|uniref:Uncharacterized protein n=1 Tax=Elysia chlorotica TaxID=188477 RepID=A0A3S0Z3K8_ELYCH|nr:hypothetical protein EGW08_023677 [Elysia chlorotica]
MKKMVQGIPEKLKKRYNSVPAKDVEDDEDDFSDFDVDDPYMNADEIKKTKPDEIVYANATAIRENQEEKKKNEGRLKNDDGLVYVSVDFPNSNLKPAQKPKNNNNNNNSGGTGSSEKKPAPSIVSQPQEDMVEYTQIDFSKTKTPPKNGIHQEVAAEVNPTLKEEEEVTAESDHDDVSAADGGADVEVVDGGPDRFGTGVAVPESTFGTAV